MTYIKFKQIVSVVLLLILSSFVTGCSDTGKQAAYDIAEQHATDHYEGATKSTSAEIQTKAQNKEMDKNSVDAKGANVVDTWTQIKYGSFSFQIEELKLGDTIYDVNSIMSQVDADAYCKWLLSGEGNFTAKADGTFGHKNTQLVFMKCRIKNESSVSTTLTMAPTVYGLQDEKIWGPGVVMDYGFSGRHEPYSDTKTGLTVKYYYTFAPNEELETVFILGFGQKGNPDNYTFAYTNPGVDIYLSSQFLSNGSTRSKLPAGSYLIPIFKDGQLVNLQ